MGEPAPQTKQEIASKLVQVLAKNGEEIPQKFIYKDGFPEAIDNPDLWKDGLLVDFSLLTSSSSSPAAGNELAKLRSALSEWGCFQVINHGIEITFLEELVEASKQFFALPVEEKLKCSIADDVFQGYGSDSVYGGTKNVNWNDRLFLTLYPDKKRKLEFYPQTPANFRGLIYEYSEKLAAMSEDFYKAMARCLDLEEDCFLKHQGQGTITGRFTCYPRCPSPDHVLGVKPHSDGCCMAILLPDNGVDGLQVQKGEQWYKVPVIPGALFVNFGDLGEVMSNGIFKSVMHRVVTNSEKDRVSVAAFCTPEAVHDIGPVRELIDDDHPQMYKKFDIFEYRRVFFETTAQGLRALDAFKL